MEKRLGYTPSASTYLEKVKGKRMTDSRVRLMKSPEPEFRISTLTLGDKKQLKDKGVQTEG